MSFRTYSTNPNSNDGLGLFDENQDPSTVNNGGRQLMADCATANREIPWADFGDTPTYVSAISFTVTGDQTATYQVDRAIRCTDSSTLYGFITASAYTTLTTVTVALVSGSLSASLSAVAVGLGPTYPGLPYNVIGQIQNKFTAAGTNTYTGTLSNITGYTEGLEVIMVPTNYNTSDTCTLNLNSLGAKSIYIQDSSTGQLYALHSGAIRASHAYKLLYTNGHFVLMNPSYESATAAYDGTTTFKIANLSPTATATPLDWTINFNDTTSTSYVKAHEVTLTKDHFQFSSGALYVEFTLRAENVAGTAYARVYRNGGAVGTEQSTTDTGGVLKSESISGWAIGDTMEIWIKTSTGTYYSAIDGTTNELAHAVTAKGYKTNVTTVATP